MPAKVIELISEMTVWNILLSLSIIGLGFAVFKIKKSLVDRSPSDPCEDDCLKIPASELYNDDQLTEDEYKKIRERMALRLKEKELEQARSKKSSADKLAELKQIIQNHAKNKAHLANPSENNFIQPINNSPDEVFTSPPTE